MTALLQKFLDKALQLFNSNPKRREPGVLMAIVTALDT